MFIKRLKSIYFLCSYRAKNSLKTFVLNWTQKQCSSFFTVWIDPIHLISTPSNCIVINTTKLPFWKRQKRIYVAFTTIPDLNDFQVLKIIVQDSTLYAQTGVDGQTKDREHLEVICMLRLKNGGKYLILGADYLPDTGISFSRTIRSCVSYFDANKSWEHLKGVLDRSHQGAIIDVANDVSNTNIFDTLKFKIGLLAVHWLNHFDQPAFDMWLEQIEQLAIQKNLDSSYRYTGCSLEYWRVLYAQGYKVDRAFAIGTNPRNWTNHY